MVKKVKAGKGEGERDPEIQFNVRVPQALLTQLDHYIADHRPTTRKQVVALALAAYLKGKA